jgi:prepilin peptidase CpaA
LTGLVQYVALLPFAVAALVTDVRRQRIYNATTYPGILVGIAVNAVHGWAATGPGRDGAWAGAWEGTLFGLSGFLACGFVMLLCFVFFPVGGGDVKLVAMIGAFLGVDHGIEVLLWTFVLGAVIAIAMLIWRVGIVELLRLTIGRAWIYLRTAGQVGTGVRTASVESTEEGTERAERGPLEQELFLGVAAVLGVVAVMLRRGVW